MPPSASALIIALTWSSLLILTLVDRYLLKSIFLKLYPLTWVDTGGTAPPGSWLTRAGTLLVFVANLTSIGLVIFHALRPCLFPPWLQLRLPIWVNIIGVFLFSVYSMWGWLVVAFNPGYTPCYRRPAGALLLALYGPYALVRHPRYAAEAIMNVGFFLFTGYWLSLLGMLGWRALRSQSLAEERYLLALAGRPYAAYCEKTGRFFPNCLRRKP